MDGQGIDRRLIALILVLTLTSAARAGYEVTDLGVLAPGTSQAAAVNQGGTVVGTSSTASGVSQAFAYDPGTGTLGDLGGISGGPSFATALNTDGRTSRRRRDQARGRANARPRKFALGAGDRPGDDAGMDRQRRDGHQ